MAKSELSKPAGFRACPWSVCRLTFLLRGADLPVQVPPAVLTVQITVAAELYYVAQVIEIGLVAEVEVLAFANEWAYQMLSVCFRMYVFKFFNLDDHDTLLLHLC